MKFDILIITFINNFSIFLLFTITIIIIIIII